MKYLLILISNYLFLLNFSPHIKAEDKDTLLIFAFSALLTGAVLFLFTEMRKPTALTEEVVTITEVKKKKPKKK